jgi:hydrogenase maturation protein HypF
VRGLRARLRRSGQPALPRRADRLPALRPKLNVPIADVAAALRHGGIVALKGLGGFHLLCDAHDEAAVAELRRRKARDAKPFAVMVANLASAGFFAEIGSSERELLRHRSRPIVLARSRGRLAPSVAPNLRDIGLMLAYTALHWLVLHALAGSPDFRSWRDAPSELALVATSANLGGEPLVASDEDARRRLAGVADLIVTHDREIVVRADDSVMRVIDGAPAYLRRARGFVPDPIDLGAHGPTVIAAGGTSRTQSRSPAAARRSSRNISATSTTARLSVSATRRSGA